jgi:succinate dehydrogenase / fumarate reductase flavoprotein subunit
MIITDTSIPEGPLDEKWSRFKSASRQVSPNNRNKYRILVIGTGLAGASAAASLAEMGFKVKAYCYQDSARRAHSVAAQGGVNASKNYKNDGDNIWRMFYDTLKGGDFRAREANVYRLAECSMSLIDQAVAQGVPFAREYGGYLDNRSFGGVQVSRTFYARGQTGQQLLLGSYQALLRQVAKGNVTLHTRHEMLDLYITDGVAKGALFRNLDNGKLESEAADVVVIASGGYGKIFYLSTLAMNCNGSAVWRAFQNGAWLAAPSWIQFHPTSLPQISEHQSKLTLMSESLRNDGRIWVPSKPDDKRPPHQIPDSERDYYLERKYPSYGNLAPRDISSRAAKEQIDLGHGIGPLNNAVYLDFKDALHSKGEEYLKERYGNLFSMYHKITGYNPYEEPMMIAPSAHFTMGGLWVDYNLMSNIKGLFVLGEANFGDHGANRLGANSLLQACVDGYFIAPYTIPHYLSGKTPIQQLNNEIAKNKEYKEQTWKDNLHHLTQIKGKTTSEEFHRRLGALLYQSCGLSRSKSSLISGSEEIKKLEQEFDRDLSIPGSTDTINIELEKAQRVKDYFGLAQLMIQDALKREESCGAHFRTEYQTLEGEALRNDDSFAYVPVWEYNTEENHQLHQETLNYEFTKMATRSYQ